MKQAFLELGEQCKAILTSFYYYKMSMDKIAERFNYTNAANAKNQKYKCLQKLKAIVAKETKGYQEV